MFFFCLLVYTAEYGIYVMPAGNKIYGRRIATSYSFKLAA
jgi:phenylalanine-4-hydroxylase